MDSPKLPLTRRELLRLAAFYGASLALPGGLGRRVPWQERRETFPQGVASADPMPDSILLWTRRPPIDGVVASTLTVDVARDESFRDVVTRVSVELSPDNDWTTRILAAGLAPSTEYWYRFTDDTGQGSRVGRTLTAPSADDPRPVRFAFVSCQNIQAGACNAYGVMMRDDVARTPDERLQFVLHLGDYVYEVVWYPEDRPQGYYSRTLKDVVRYPTGEKVGDLHIPVTVDDYRALYRGYLSDPDLQNARARWPFIAMWDNHEFSWKGWQSQQDWGGARPSQTRKVAANQAWFEYQPARVARAAANGDRFVAPTVSDAPLVQFDEFGLGQESNNLAAIDSLAVARAFRWGRNVDLILTDNRSHRAEPVMQRKDAAPFVVRGFPGVRAQDVVEILDAGRDYDSGHPPPTIKFAGTDIPNPRQGAAPQSMLGEKQKAWFADTLRRSTAKWKLWGNSVGMLDWRMDFQRLNEIPGMPATWPTSGYAMFADDDWSGYRHERAELVRLLEQEGITGVVSVAGDRHAFMSGVVSPTMPPAAHVPGMAEFVTGSISAPGLLEGLEYNVPATDPLRAVYVGAGTAVNVSAMHGVRASAEYSATRDAARALALRNPDVAPHLSFVDAGGHGFARVVASSDDVHVEFVCIPRPLERAADGGPVRYRLTQRVLPWRAGEAPRVELVAREGDIPVGSLPSFT